MVGSRRLRVTLPMTPAKFSQTILHGLKHSPSGILTLVECTSTRAYDRGHLWILRPRRICSGYVSRFCHRQKAMKCSSFTGTRRSNYLTFEPIDSILIRALASEVD